MDEIGGVILMIVILISVGVGAWVLSSKMEAQVYTELTGKKVTTNQAMWVDLRVVEPAKQD